MLWNKQFPKVSPFECFCRVILAIKIHWYLNFKVRNHHWDLRRDNPGCIAVICIKTHGKAKTKGYISANPIRLSSLSVESFQTTDHANGHIKPPWTFFLS